MPNLKFLGAIGLAFVLLLGALKITADRAFAWKDAAVAARTSLAASEKARGTERSGDLLAASDAAIACNARVSEARRAAAAIKTITKVIHDPSDPSPRGLITADELRGALQPGR